MSLAADILAAALAAVFLAVGLAKIAGAGNVVAEFERFGYPSWFRVLTGVIEAAGGALLVVGIVAADAAGLAGAVVLGVVMIGAIATHVRMHDGADKLAPSVVLLVLLGAEVILRATA